MSYSKSGLRRLLTLGIALVITILFFLSSCTSNSPRVNESTLSEISSTGRLKVGYLIFPPTTTKNPTTGELGGHHVETIKEIARLNKWKLEFIETDWANFAAGLNSHRFDVSIVPTFVTVPRALSVYFTRPLFFAGNSAVVRINDRRFTNLQSIDQSGVVVAVTQGEAGDEYARANFQKAKITRYSGGDQSLVFQAVISGRADIALGDAYVTSQFVKANSTRVKDLFAESPYNLTPVSWAVRRGDDELLNFLNSSLEAFDYQGQLLEWERKAGANWLHLKKVWEFSKK
ncbi:ABC transporter substrate-binding protein [Scytonema hofmannii PCC 7110]|uniref:ABC transporter substrate-binding protein n=1 Tax=Scytonema hofmannii PCC 7110 TaxID=128403 RepID=A0A139X548_9CYAN|nr:ABC transporter substrate-binding protein [Scytonema hofmannii]KYC39786.1 ABC transporter substrate-binding protein [Scytonema hofmannii PCC 7110]